jgi:hypothetical protein
MIGTNIPSSSPIPAQSRYRLFHHSDPKKGYTWIEKGYANAQALKFDVLIYGYDEAARAVIISVEPPEGFLENWAEPLPNHSKVMSVDVVRTELQLERLEEQFNVKLTEDVIDVHAISGELVKDELHVHFPRVIRSNKEKK